MACGVWKGSPSTGEDRHTLNPVSSTDHIHKLKYIINNMLTMFFPKKQDGHVKEVHLLTFQHDGALVCSGDFAGVGNVWDLRCGKKIMALTGHVKRIVSGDFAPNGFQVNLKHICFF
jgi:WD40 repeat protein